ncbi:MAG: CvpA family protein [Gemmiger sp.]
MSFSVGLIYDLLFVVLLAWAAIGGMRRGFVSGLLRLGGSVAGIIGATWATREWAVPLYDRFIGPPLRERVAEAAARQSAETSGWVEQNLGILPEAARDAVAGLLQNAADLGTETLVQQVAAAVQPLLLPLLQAVIFMVVLALIRLVFRLLERLFRHLNGVPLLGTVNKMFGFCFGFVSGTLDCWFAAILLWLAATVTTGQLSFLNSAVLAQSRLYSFFANFNPFLIHY